MTPSIRTSLRLLIVILALSLSAACGGGDDNNGNGNNNGTDGGADAGMDVDEDVESDVEEDTDESDADADPDTGDDDADDDGVPDAEDNCPDTPNAGQADVDRDGLGDDCDSLPFVYDPTNPDDLEVTPENEDQIDNDQITGGQEYDLSLPFIVEGNVGPLDGGEGDFDFFTVSVDEPTAVFVHIKAETSDLWPGGAALGYDLRNTNVDRFVLGNETGQDHFREVFLPVAGNYAFLVTDTRNLIGSAQNVGSEDGHKYTMSVSEIPLPEGDEVTLPSAPSDNEVQYRLRTYRVDVSNTSGITATSTGVPNGDNSVHLPALAVYDPAARHTLGHTSPAQADTNTLRAQLDIKTTGYDEVVVIEDHYQSFGSNNALFEVSPIEIESEFETLRQRQDDRASRLVWLQSGQQVSGTIGPPVSTSPTSLEQDSDYYLSVLSPGRTLNVTVTPKQDSLLQPRISVGVFSENQGNSTFFGLGTSKTADTPGEPVTVEQFIEPSDAGELTIRVQHAPNSSRQAPAGGPKYGYDISVDYGETETEEIASLPAVVTGTLPEEDSIKLFRFSADAGDRLNFRLEKSSDRFADEVIVFDATTYEELASDYAGAFGTHGRTAMVAPQDGDYIVGVFNQFALDDDAPSHDFELGIERIQGEEFSSFPASSAGTVDDEPFPAWFRATVTADTAYQVGVDAPDFDQRIRAYRADDMSLIKQSSGSTLVFPSNDATEVFIEVAEKDDGGDASFAFDIEMDEVPTIDATPGTTASGELSTETSSQLVWFTVPEGAFSATVTPTGDWTPDVELRRGDTLNGVSNVDVFDGQVVYTTTEQRRYGLVVAVDSIGSASAPFGFEVDVTTLEASSAVDETEPNDDASDAEMISSTPAAYLAAMEENASDHFTVDLAADQRLWVLTNRPAAANAYNVDPGVRVFSPLGNELVYERDNGPEWHSMVQGLQASEAGTYDIAVENDWTSRTGDYLIYVFTSPAP
jgi:hypothetical protein